MKGQVQIGGVLTIQLLSLTADTTTAARYTPA